MQESASLPAQLSLVQTVAPDAPSTRKILRQVPVPSESEEVTYRFGGFFFEAWAQRH